MVTSNRLQTYWASMKPLIHSEWPLLSETALETIRGDYDLFLIFLKESYPNFPLEEGRARDKLQKFLNQVEGI